MQPILFSSSNSSSNGGFTGTVINCQQYSCLLLKVSTKVKLPTIPHGSIWEERKYSCYLFLTSALDGEWSASCASCALPPQERTPSTQWLRLGALQSQSGYRGWKKNPLHLLGIEPKLSSHSQDTILAELHQLT